MSNQFVFHDTVILSALATHSLGNTGLETEALFWWTTKLDQIFSWSEKWNHPDFGSSWGSYQRLVIDVCSMHKHSQFAKSPN